MQKNILSILIKFKIPRKLFLKKNLVSNLHVQKYIRIKYKINKFFLWNSAGSRDRHTILASFYDFHILYNLLPPRWEHYIYHQMRTRD